jgi:hypothetical protein
LAALLRYDHYKVLGISRQADAAQVKRAFRSRAKYCHPDVNTSPQAAVVFHAVHEAYRILSDPELRQRYDEQLRSYRKAGDQASPPPMNAGFRSFLRRERPPGRWDILAYRGLHLTGLLFGIALTTSVLIGLVFYELPGFTLAFTAIGIGILPDSVAELRQRVPARRPR